MAIKDLISSIQATPKRQIKALIKYLQLMIEWEPENINVDEALIIIGAAKKALAK